MINNHSYEELYQLYLDKRFDDIEQIAQESKTHELKQWAKSNNLVWYQGSKASFLQALKHTLTQSKIIRGGEFRHE